MAAGWDGLRGGGRGNPNGTFSNEPDVARGCRVRRGAAARRSRPRRPTSGARALPAVPAACPDRARPALPLFRRGRQGALRASRAAVPRRCLGPPAPSRFVPFVGRLPPPAVPALADAVDARASCPPDGSGRRRVRGEAPVLLRLQNATATERPVPRGALTAAAASAIRCHHDHPVASRTVSCILP